MKNGFIAITTIVIVLAVTLVSASTVVLLAIGEGQSSLALFKGEDVLAFSEGCMEDALKRVRTNTSYAGGTFTRPEGTCLITVVPSGSIRTITSEIQGTSLYKRKIQVVVTTSATGLSLTSWREI